MKSAMNKICGLAVVGIGLGVSGLAQAGMTSYTDEGAWASSVISGTIGNANLSSATFGSGTYTNLYATSGGGYTVAANNVNFNFNSSLVADAAVDEGSHFFSPDNVNFLTNSTPLNSTENLVLTVVLPGDVKAAGLYWASTSTSSVTLQFYDNATAVGTPWTATLPTSGTFFPFFGVISTTAFNRFTVTAAAAANASLATPDVQYANQVAGTTPEPTALGLLLVGVFGGLMLRRRLAAQRR